MTPKKKPAPRRAPNAPKAAAPVEVKAEAVEWPVEAPESVEDQMPTPVEEITTEIPAPQAEQTKGTFIMTDAMETAKTYAEEAKTRIQGAVSEMNEKAKAAMEKSTKAMEELSELTKGNYEALVESSKIAAKGLETLSQEAVEFGRKSFEKSSTTFKSFASVKTPADFFQLHSELMTATLDSFASEAAKNSEAMLKLVGDISKPISNRVAVVSDKVKSLAA